MKDSFSRLSDLIDRLKDAHGREEWEEVSKIDSMVQCIVVSTGKLIDNHEDRNTFHRQLVLLQGLYDQILEDNVSRRQGLGTELKKLNKQHNAISQYLQSSSYQ